MRRVLLLLTSLFPCFPVSVSLRQQQDMLFDCLEHYAHPSNTGPWTSTLAAFLRASASFFLKARALALHPHARALASQTSHHITSHLICVFR
jgi:hypothetical protein